MIVVVTKLSWLQSVRALKAWQGDKVGSDGTIWSRKGVRGEWCYGRFVLSQFAGKKGAGRRCGEDNHLGYLSGETAWAQEGPEWRQLGEGPTPPCQAAAALWVHIRDLSAVNWLQRFFWGYVGEWVVALCGDGQKHRQTTPPACAPVLYDKVELNEWKQYMWLLRLSI